MNYNKIININKNFQFSVNLEFDLNNIDKIKEYIPTKDACNVIKQYLVNINNSKNRANTLIGPYGKGKSHLLLIIIAILNNYNENDKLDEFIEKVKDVDLELYDMIIEIRKNKTKLMPIIINSNYNDLNQAFLLGISEALDRENLSNIVINTYFEVALKIIDKWENNYSEAIEQVKKCLNEHNCTLKVLKTELSKYSQKYYEIFKTVYSCVLHGQEFNPLINGDLIKIYADIIYELAKTNYSGVFIVFDEFSKFLENVDNTRMMKDLKILQDFAELATRSNNTNQIHLTCVTHKTINEYLKSFKEEKVNAFKTVEGRFKEIYFTGSIEQNYEIISYALQKTSSFNNVFEKFYDTNISFYKSLEELEIFKSIDNIKKVLYKGCFPLNPLTVYSLINISEKIAQNERTLFTFLTDDDIYSFKSFLNSQDDGLFNVDKIYDYFNALLKKENDENIKTIWFQTENAIKQVTDENEVSILKTIAIIYMVNETSILFPNLEVISLCLGIGTSLVEDRLNSLMEKGILRKKKITDEIDFTNNYNFELTKEIKSLCNSKITSVNEKEILNKVVSLGYTLPRRYNEEFKMTRYFKNVFMTEEELLNIANFKYLLEEETDGIIINLLRTSKNLNEVFEKYIKIADKKIIIKIPRKSMAKGFTNLLKEYEALRILKINYKDSVEITNELNVMLEELILIIEDAMKLYFDDDNIQEYWHDGKYEKKIKNISSYVSNICNDIYFKTPIINNELINKNELSAPIKKARNIVIDTILTGNSDLIKSSTSAEATIYKSIYEKRENNDIKLVVNKIENFVLKTDNTKISFGELYEELKKEPYSIRKGLIPVLLAMALYKNADNIIIYYMNKEIELNSSNLVKINDDADKYYIMTEHGTTEKIKYIAQLMKIYNIENIDITRVNIKYIIDSMKKWILSLPRIIRDLNEENESLNIKQNYVEFKKTILKADLNNNEFLFKRLLEIFNAQSYEDIITNLVEMKSTFDTYIDKYSSVLINDTKKIFNKNLKGSLPSILKDWYSTLSDKEINKIYNNKTKMFLSYIENIVTYDEFDVVEQLSKIMTNLYIEDWSEKDYELYISELHNVIALIKDVEETESSRKKIIFIDGDKTLEKHLKSESDISVLGSTLKNNLEDIMSEYGDSIEEHEKISILLDIIKEYI